nr:unnamed protein product [Salmo salar]XP_014030420.1 unnamed protein product [Salmo salar]|eukprot:XP_014030419.1 PREDICTED: uncharacterized protein LOC106587059 isoform X1 [Salmo salar]
MYRLYKEKNTTSSAKFWVYRDIFKQQSLNFGQPRSDTCGKCDAFFTKMSAATSEEEKRKIAVESELHHRKAEKAYTQLQSDTEWAKANADCHVISVDLQGVMYTPNLTHSNVYYQRQLSNFNLCIQELGKEDPAYMCVWHEGIAHRGSIEVASCILKWVKTKFTPLTKPEVRKLIIFSDRCCGQNNNWRMLNLMSMLISMGYFTQVEQKFMVSGHSFLPCDRSFATIEKRRKVSVLHTPDDVSKMMLEAQPAKPFKVMRMQCEDFRHLPDSVLKRPAGLQITSVRWLKVTVEDPWNLYARQSHSLFEGWKSWLISKPKQGATPQPPYFASHYPRAYESTLPIKKNKYQDLMTMLNYLPAAARSFYKSLQSE